MRERQGGKRDSVRVEAGNRKLIWNHRMSPFVQLLGPGSEGMGIKRLEIKRSSLGEYTMIRRPLVYWLVGECN